MSSPSIQPMKNAVARHLTWGAYILLILMMIITSLPGMIPEGSSPFVILCVKLVPLALVFPGLTIDSLRAYTWLCFIVLFYFTQSVVETFLSSGANIDFLITLLTVIIFLSAMFYIKWERSRGRDIF